MERGNEPATVRVRPLFLAAAILLALAAALAPTQALLPLVTDDLVVLVFLAALTLLAEGIAYWYLPSFAKRAVLGRAFAAWVAPALFALAVGAEAAARPRLSDIAVAIALTHFAATVLLSVALGARWRGGVPFWSAAGSHRGDDRAAAFVLLLSFLGMLALAALLVLAPLAASALRVGWPLSLLLFVLGALAHLLPRSRGRSGIPLLVVAGALAGGVGAAWVAASDPSTLHAPRAALALALGLPLAAFAIVVTHTRKPPGPRLRQAGPPLILALALLTLALVAANVLVGLDLGGSGLFSVALVLLASLGLAFVGLTLLTLPVLFNQRPDAQQLPLVLVFALLGSIAAVAIPGTVAPPLLLALGVAWWLRALWPLRKPRRECSPDEAS